jgi:hypothetical protein
VCLKEVKDSFGENSPNPLERKTVHQKYSARKEKKNDESLGNSQHNK